MRILSDQNYRNRNLLSYLTKYTEWLAKFTFNFTGAFRGISGAFLAESIHISVSKTNDSAVVDI